MVRELKSVFERIKSQGSVMLSVLALKAGRRAIESISGCIVCKTSSRALGPPQGT